MKEIDLAAAMKDAPVCGHMYLAKDEKWTSDQPTADIRFIKRDGERILQQRFQVLYFKNGYVEASESHWRDVPIVEEETEKGT